MQILFYLCLIQFVNSQTCDNNWNCPPCDPGWNYYQLRDENSELERNPSCRKCPEGMYSAGGARQAYPNNLCKWCGPGKTSAAGSASCMLCPAGTFNPGISEINNAAVYDYFLGRDISRPYIPYNGNYDLYVMRYCIQCPPGTSSSVSGATSASTCVSCVAGSYSPSSGSSVCLDCPIGTYSITTGASTCSLCAPGTFSTSTRAISIATCLQCPAGTFSHAGSSTCYPCYPGTYALAGSSSCSLCPAGTFGNRAGLETASCSGVCESCTTAGSTVSPPSTQSSLSCLSGGARSVPTSLGMQVWPAAHPNNPRNVDLLVTPLTLCQQMTSVTACATAASFTGTDGLTRYVVGTTEEFNVEPSESLVCSTS